MANEQGSTTNGEEDGEKTVGEKIRIIQANSIDDLAAFAKDLFAISTQPTRAIKAQEWAEAWTTLWKSCAVRLDQIRIVINENA